MGEKVVFCVWWSGEGGFFVRVDLIIYEEWYCEISRRPPVRKWSRITLTRIFPGKGFCVLCILNDFKCQIYYFRSQNFCIVFL